MKASVSLWGKLSETFEIGNGVKLDCDLSPTMFSNFLSLVLSNTLTDSTLGVLIQSRPGANLFSASQFKFARKARNVLVRELMFTDNTTFVEHNHQKKYSLVSENKLKKTEVMYPIYLISYNIGQEIQIEGQALTQANKFKYLSLTVHQQQQTRCGITYTNVICF